MNFISCFYVVVSLHLALMHCTTGLMETLWRARQEKGIQRDHLKSDVSLYDKFVDAKVLVLGNEMARGVWLSEISNERIWQNMVSNLPMHGFTVLKGTTDRPIKDTAEDREYFNATFRIDMLDDASKDLLYDARYTGVFQVTFSDPPSAQFMLVFHSPLFDEFVFQHICNWRAELVPDEDKLNFSLSNNLNKVAELRAGNKSIPQNLKVVERVIGFPKNSFDIEIMDNLDSFFRECAHHENDLLTKGILKMGVYFNRMEIKEKHGPYIPRNLVIIIETFDIEKLRDRVWADILKQKRKGLLQTFHTACGPSGTELDIPTVEELNKKAQCTAGKMVKPPSSEEFKNTAATECGCDKKSVRRQFREYILQNSDYEKDDFQYLTLLEHMRAILIFTTLDYSEKYIAAGIGISFLTNKDGIEYLFLCVLFQITEAAAVVPVI